MHGATSSLGMTMIGAAATLLLLTGAGHADDSCTLALNNRCEEPTLGPGYCATATDSSDCAAAYVIDDSDTRRLDATDVWYLSDSALRLARNEIFARHGYSFNSADLKAFFGARSWYAPEGRDVSLSAVEQVNVEFLHAIENDGAVETPTTFGVLPWASWRADVVRASGITDRAVVDGVRALVSDAEFSRVQLIRPDLEDAFYFSPEAGDEWGAITWWGLFPPVLLDPYVHGLTMVPKPLGTETLFGEQVTHVRLDWESDEAYESLHGDAWVTSDGIFLQVDVSGVFAECCGGDENIAWTLQYHLENLERGRPDPGELEPPTGVTWTFPG